MQIWSLEEMKFSMDF